jgi:hypothetical protein
MGEVSLEASEARAWVPADIAIAPKIVAAHKDRLLVHFLMRCTTGLSDATLTGCHPTDRTHRQSDGNVTVS